jgi:hypothetical protein
VSGDVPSPQPSPRPAYQPAKLATHDLPELRKLLKDAAKGARRTRAAAETLRSGLSLAYVNQEKIRKLLDEAQRWDVSHRNAFSEIASREGCCDDPGAGH